MDTLNESVEPIEASEIDFSSEKTDDATLQSAYKAYQKKSYSQALNLLLPGFDRDKTGTYANFIGNCYQKLGSKNDAVHFWQKAISQNPANYQAYISLGNASFANNETKQALIYWHTALCIAPEKAQINYNLAIAYSKIDSRLEAVYFYEKFLKYCENQQGHDYAQVSKIIGRFRTKAAELLKYATAAVEANKLNIAVQCYMKALKNYPLLPKVILNVAKIFSCDRNFSKAIEYYKFALKVDEKLKICMVDMANAYIAKKEYALAYAYFTRFLNSYKDGKGKFNEIERIRAYAKSKIPPEYDFKKHLNMANDFEHDLKYKDALDELENYKVLSNDDSTTIADKTKRLNLLVHPEKELIKQLVKKIEEFEKNKDSEAAIALCERIAVVSVFNSPEFQWAGRKKQEIRYTLFKTSGNKNV